jgi:KaiC/GvpD/RAD55 family RecA-like ATPase
VAKTAPTGIIALDKALMNGVPKGFTVLVTGVPGTGLELFAKQFAGASGARDENVVYFTTSERDEDIVGTMQDFGWRSDLTILNIGNQYYETVLARRLEASRFRQEGLSMKDLTKLRVQEAGVRREVNFLTALSYEISQLKPPFRVVVDALDFFLEYYDPPEVLSALRTVKAHVQRTEGIALLTMVNGVHDARVQSGVEEIVDCIFELERVREGAAFKRYLIIRKVRNHPEKTGIHPLTLSKDGLEIE